MPKVIYVTGAPAAGKSSTVALLRARMPELLVWEYGARLTEHVGLKRSLQLEQEEIREKSAQLVTPEDVAEVDQALLNFIQQNRRENSVLIDSHPVTKEAYGFRVTPFSLDQFAALNPDEIWVFQTSPEETRRRIRADAAGRPMVTAEDARMHTFLQASVAATYGMATRCPVYIFDTAISQEQLVSTLISRLS